MMLVHQLNHYTLKCAARDLEAVRAFYTAVIGLVEGPRPAFSFAGHWLYSGAQPIVHLAVLLDEPAPPATGPLDHIAFTGRDVAAARSALDALGVAFDELPVPGFPLHQIFVKDPLGLRIELTFATDSAEAAA
jgi:catechol 2,3-dioxygenase-like lactoylglutathione lyase family enzyme